MIEHHVPKELMNDHIVNPWSWNCYLVLWGVLQNRKLPKGIVKIGKRNFTIKVWYTKFSVDYFWWDLWYRITNLSNKRTYYIKKWEEKILWRWWEILIDESDTQASREHLKLRVDDESNLFLRDISEHWTFIDVEDNTETGKGLIKCEKMTPEEIKKFKNSKKSKEAEYFYGKDERYRPTNKINLWNGKILYITNILKGLYRKEIIWYIQYGDCIDLRMFYKSGSEWVWRSCPWVREDEQFSKWEKIKDYCYETTTMVMHKLWEVFNKQICINMGETEDPIDSTLNVFWYNFLSKKMEKEVQVDVMFPGSYICDIMGNIDLDKVSGDHPMSGSLQEIKDEIADKQKSWKNRSCVFHSTNKMFFYRDKGGKTKALPPSFIKEVYGQIKPMWLDYLWMKKVYDWSYSYNHEKLWKVITDIYQAKWNWKLINILFSKTEKEPNKVWIQEIQYADAKVNSFWIINNPINAAPLTWKPIEYWDNTPYLADVGFWSDTDTEVSFRNWDYVDIRQLYQDNPIIKHYKKLEWLL